MKKTNAQKARERGKNRQDNHREDRYALYGFFCAGCQCEVPPAGRKGAAAALERLETAEERAHAKLEAALKAGNRFAIQDAQDFWLKCSETLRRLDLAIELSRRTEEEQISLRKARDAVLFVSEWVS